MLCVRHAHIQPEGKDKPVARFSNERPGGRRMTCSGKNNPNPRQGEAMDWIKGFIREHAIPPTVREIGEALGIKSSSDFDLLEALERKGLLKRGDLGARSPIVKGERLCSRACEEVQVIGRIAAGTSMEPVEDNAG